MAEKKNTQGQNPEETEDSPEHEKMIEGQNKEEAEAEAPSQRRLTVGQEEEIESYLWCAGQFYTLQEMIKFMTANHGVTKQRVAKVFAEMLKGMNAEAYLRESAQRYLEKKKTQDQRLEAEALLQRAGSGSVAGSSAPSQSDGASSSSSRRRR